jgi:hypothetical protein
MAWCLINLAQGKLYVLSTCKSSVCSTISEQQQQQQFVYIHVKPALDLASRTKTKFGGPWVIELFYDAVST